jgi:hypothetical protein
VEGRYTWRSRQLYRIERDRDVTKDVSGDPVQFFVSNESQRIEVEGNHWIVDSTFDIAAQSKLTGSINATVAAQDSYVHNGAAWLIANETWNHLTLYEQFQA